MIFTNEGKKILIVDDDKGTRHMIRRLLLKDRKYEIEDSENGLEAIEKLKIFKADLIIIDIMMPGQDGYKTCEYIRNNLNMKDVKIIGVSGSTEEIGERFIQVFGADSFLEKPFMPNILKENISFLLEEKIKK